MYATTLKPDADESCQCAAQPRIVRGHIVRMLAENRFRNSAADRRVGSNSAARVQVRFGSARADVCAPRARIVHTAA